MNKQEMAIALGETYLTFPQAQLTREIVLAWLNLFQNEPADRFSAALKACVLEPGRKFLPTPGEVEGYLEKMRPGAILWSAEEVWNQLCAHASKGMSESEVMARIEAYPAIQAALRYVTWEVIRYAEEEDLKWARKRFIDLYGRIVERDRKIEKQEEIAQLDYKKADPRIQGIVNKLLN